MAATNNVGKVQFLPTERDEKTHQFSLFDPFDQIEDQYEDDSIFISTLNWNAKFEQLAGGSQQKGAYLYCSRRKEFEQLRKELVKKGWIETYKAPLGFMKSRFVKQDKLIEFYLVQG